MLDPTRPVMVDGGNCLVDESLPVNGVHYQEAFCDYPDEAYTLAKAYTAHEKPVIGWGKVLWRLVPDRPIFMGESYFVRGSNPAAFSQFAGEGCFAGWGPATQQGAGLLAKMLAEGYRWHGVAAHHFWFGCRRGHLAPQLVEAGLRALPPVELDIRRRQHDHADLEGLQRHALKRSD